MEAASPFSTQPAATARTQQAPPLGDFVQQQKQWQQQPTTHKQSASLPWHHAADERDRRSTLNTTSLEQGRQHTRSGTGSHEMVPTAAGGFEAAMSPHSQGRGSRDLDLFDRSSYGSVHPDHPSTSDPSLRHSVRGDSSSVASSLGPASPSQSYTFDTRGSAVSNGSAMSSGLAAASDYLTQQWPLSSGTQWAEGPYSQSTWPQMLPEELSAMSDAEWKARSGHQLASPPLPSWPSPGRHIQSSERPSAGQAEAANSRNFGSIASGPVHTYSHHLHQQSSLANRDRIPEHPRITSSFAVLVENLDPTIREEDLVMAFLDPPPYPPHHPLARPSTLFSNPQERGRPSPFASTQTVKFIDGHFSEVTGRSASVYFADERDCHRALTEMQGVLVASQRQGSTARPIRITYRGSSARTDLADDFSTRHTHSSSISASLQDTVSSSTSPRTTFNPASNTARYSTPTAAEIASHSASVPIPTSWPGGIPSLPGFPTIPATGAFGPVDVGLRHGTSLRTSYGGPASLAGTGFTLGPSTLPSPSSALDPNNTTVFVGGLSSLLSEDTLKTFFSPFGAIAYVKIPPGKGCGFVSFIRKADAEKAIERMQGFPVGGCRIRLSWGRSQGEKSQHLAQQQINNLHQLANLAGVGDLRDLRPNQLAYLASLGQALAQNGIDNARSPTGPGRSAGSAHPPTLGDTALQQTGGAFSPPTSFGTTPPAWSHLDGVTRGSTGSATGTSHTFSAASGAYRSPPDSRLSATSQPFDISRSSRLTSAGHTASSSEALGENLSAALNHLGLDSDQATSPLGDFAFDDLSLRSTSSTSPAWRPADAEWSGALHRSGYHETQGILGPLHRPPNAFELSSRAQLSDEGAEAYQPGSYQSTLSDTPFPVWTDQRLPRTPSGPSSLAHRAGQPTLFEDREGAGASSRGSSLTNRDTVASGLTVATSLSAKSIHELQKAVPKSYRDDDGDSRHNGFSPFSPLIPADRQLHGEEETSPAVIAAVPSESTSTVESDAGKQSATHQHTSGEVQPAS
ncbi:unnamed protein product [Parajaminaea phylloscopi]